MFPSDDILISRGKYSTLSKERREQLERVKKICDTIQSASYATMRDCEQRPPTNGENLKTLEVCLKNMSAARERIITLSLGMAELEPYAWGAEVAA